MPSSRILGILGLAVIVIPLAGCGTASKMWSGLSSISGMEWFRARADAGLPTPERPVQDPAEAAKEPPETQASAKDPYQATIENAYRQGVRDAVRQLTDGLGRDPRWTWVAPMVQEVWIPAQIVSGVMIPGHREWVMIRPGQWQAQFGLPLGPPPQIQPTGGQAPAPPKPAR